jgi:2-C-methyl-D-erythritol 4-phosphate cytidylyltransferase
MYSVIILAAGKGTRLNLGYNKVLYQIKNKTILEYSVERFLKDKDIDEIIIVVNEMDELQIKELFSGKNIQICYGGITRQDSVYNGLSKVTNKYVLIHDGARPYIDISDLLKIEQTVKTSACVLVQKVKESLAKQSFNKLKTYLNREDYILLKTPQAFLTEKIKKAYELATKNDNMYTDDASVYMNELNEEVITIESSEFNIKLTTEFDLKILEEIL